MAVSGYGIGRGRRELVLKCIERGYIDKHFAGTIKPKEENLFREHLKSCNPCRIYYHRHLIVSELDPAGLDAKTRIGIGLGFFPRKIKD